MQQILSATTHLLGVVILTHILSYRLSHGSCLTKSSWPRICTLLVFADSWLYIFTTGILVLGAGLDISRSNCTLGIWCCAIFYISSKLFVFIFLRTSAPSLPYELLLILEFEHSGTGVHCLEKVSGSGEITLQGVRCFIRSSGTCCLGNIDLDNIDRG